MRIVLISGPAGSGKDAVGEILRDLMEKNGEKVLVTHYADLIKHVAASFCGWNGVKDIAGRTILQTVGADVVRNWNEDYWVDFLVNMLTLFGDRYRYVLIPDARFPNEISKIREKWPDTVHLRVERPGFKSHLTEKQQNHITETALNGVRPDVLIQNDGSLEDLTAKTQDFYARLAGDDLLRGIPERLDGQITMAEWMRAGFDEQTARELTELSEVVL